MKNYWKKQFNRAGTVLKQIKIKKNTMKRTLFITGSSSGIGKATVKYFSKKGWNVAATMRNPENESELTKHENVKLFKLDVTDNESIQKAINEAISHFGNIDVLVNNAGYGTVGAFEAASSQQIQKQFDTNVFGLMNATRAILPYFRKKKEGVIINIASVGGRMTFPLYSMYHATKWAVEGFSESLQFELNQFNIRVKIIEPGPIKTDFYDRSQELFKKDGLPDYDDYQNIIMPNMQNFSANAPGPEVVAKKIYKAATDNRKKIRYPVGGGAPLILFLRRIIPGNWFYAIIKLVLEK